MTPIMMKTPAGIPLRGVAMGLLALATAFGCGDDGPRRTRTPGIEAEPPDFLFPKIPVGNDVDRLVEVKNDGQGELVIVKIAPSFREGEEFELYWRATAEGQQYQGIGRDGTDHFRYPIRIAGGESMFLVLNFRPESERPFRGSISIETNVPDERTFTIPVTVTETGAEISVAPTNIDFGRVAARDEASRDVTVTNTGQVDLTIESILLNGSQEFIPTVGGRDPRRQAEVLADPDGDGRPGLAPGEAFVIKVLYTPQIEGPDAAEMSILSSDPRNREVRVTLAANGATPCLDVSPPAIEFRTSLVNREDTRPITIESCGGAALEITKIELAADSDAAFQLIADSLPELPTLIPAASPDEPPPSRAIRVSFTPREQRIYNGKLVITSNDPVRPKREISLLGRGVLNACPQARAERDEFFVLPLDVVRLDGSPSVDQDGPNNQPVQWEWVVVDRPQGSLAQPLESFHNAGDPANGGSNDDPTTPTSVFFVDLAGTYTLELRVMDNLGLSSTVCDTTAVVTIVAKPDDAIHIQLTWSTANDPDETDTQGTDLDLHLLNPLADNWFTAPYDCYFSNPQPDWGQLEDPSDDPTLDIDDINGGGPENVSLAKPEITARLGGPYLVGVHYFRSTDLITGFDYGETEARVRIFLNGQLTWDFSGDGEPGTRTMVATDHFWEVAEIHWPDQQIVTRDRYYDQRP